MCSQENTREAGFLGEVRRYIKLDHAVHRHYLTASLQVFEFMIPASCFSPSIVVSDRLASPPRLCLHLLAVHGSLLGGRGTLSFQDPGYFLQATECGPHSYLLVSAEAYCVSCRALLLKVSQRPRPSLLGRPLL